MADSQFSFRDKHGNPTFIDCFGDGGYLISIRGKTILFGWSDRFGPLPTTKDGRGLELGHKHPFWRAASLWNLQGRRTDGRNAVWHEPKRPVLKHLGGRNYRVLEDGEEGWDW
jgi:hypothetical protein